MGKKEFVLVISGRRFSGSGPKNAKGLSDREKGINTWERQILAFSSAKGGSGTYSLPSMVSGCVSFAAEGSVLFLLELAMEEVEGLEKKGCFRLLK